MRLIWGRGGQSISLKLCKFFGIIWLFLEFQTFPTKIKIPYGRNNFTGTKFEMTMYDEKGRRGNLAGQEN